MCRVASRAAAVAPGWRARTAAAAPRRSRGEGPSRLGAVGLRATGHDMTLLDQRVQVGRQRAGVADPTHAPRVRRAPEGRVAVAAHQPETALRRRGPARVRGLEAVPGTLNANQPPGRSTRATAPVTVSSSAMPLRQRLAVTPAKRSSGKSRRVRASPTRWSTPSGSAVSCRRARSISPGTDRRLSPGRRSRGPGPAARRGHPGRRRSPPRPTGGWAPPAAILSAYQSAIDSQVASLMRPSCPPPRPVQEPGRSDDGPGSGPPAVSQVAEDPVADRGCGGVGHGGTLAEPRLQVRVVADQREVVDLADEAALRAGLELAGHDHAGEQHRPAVLCDGGDHPRPTCSGTSDGRRQGLQLGDPQQVLLQDQRRGAPPGPPSRSPPSTSRSRSLR